MNHHMDRVTNDNPDHKCPGCGSANYLVAIFSTLHKCWDCGLAFDEPEHGECERWCCNAAWFEDDNIDENEGFS